MIRLMHHGHELQQRGSLVTVTDPQGETKQVIEQRSISALDEEGLNRIIIAAGRRGNV